MNASPLFRSQALAYASVRQYGSILLLRPASLSWLTALLCMIGVAMVLFFSMATYTRKEQVSGIVMPRAGLIRVQSLHAGVVLEVKVREDDPVHAGDVLFVLAGDPSRSASGDSADAQIAALLRSRRDELVEARQRLLRAVVPASDAVRRRAADLDGELRAIDAQILSQRRRVARSENASARNLRALDACAANAALPHDPMRAAGERRSTLAGPSGTPLLGNPRVERGDPAARDCAAERAAESGGYAPERAPMEQASPPTILVRAPQAGVVNGIVTQPGQTVTVGQVLGNLSPAGSLLEAQLYAPSRAAGFAKVGMPVQIRYRAYPFQKFGQFQGKVSEVSRGPLPAEEWPGGGARSTEPVYRIRVELPRQDVTVDGVARPLLAGMMLDASLLLDERKLYQWLFAPLHGVAGGGLT